MAIDRNVRARAYAYFRAYNHFHKQPRQHKGPLTRSCRDVMRALIWLTGRRTSIAYCSIAAEAQVSLDTVWRALKRLRAAGLITWTNRYERTTRSRTTNAFKWLWPQMPANTTETENPREDQTTEDPKGASQPIGERIAPHTIGDPALDAAIGRLLQLKPPPAHQTK